MKRVLLAACMTLVSAGAFAGAKQSYTADYYRAMSHKYEGKTVKLNVTHLEAREFADGMEVKEGYKMMWAYTAYRDQPGGYMEVAFAVGCVDRYIKRLGLQEEHDNRYRYKIRAVRGKLVKGQSVSGKPIWYLRVDK